MLEMGLSYLAMLSLHLVKKVADCGADETEYILHRSG